MSPKKLTRAPQRTATPSWRKRKEALRRAVIVCHQLRQKKPDDFPKKFEDDEIEAKKDPITKKTMRKIERKAKRIVTDSVLIENNRVGNCWNTEKEKDIDKKHKNSEKYPSYHHTIPEQQYSSNCNKYKQSFFFHIRNKSWITFSPLNFMKETATSFNKNTISEVTIQCTREIVIK